MFNKLKSIDKPKINIGIITEVANFRNGKEVGTKICVSFTQDNIRLAGWFDKSKIKEIFDKDYSKMVEK